MMNNMSQAKYPYLVTAVGIGLMAISEIYSYARAMMFRAVSHYSGTGTGFTGARQFGGGFGFGLPSILTTLAVIIGIVGVVWLGLELTKSASMRSK